MSEAPTTLQSADIMRILDLLPKRLVAFAIRARRGLGEPTAREAHRRVHVVEAQLRAEAAPVRRHVARHRPRQHDLASAPVQAAQPAHDVAGDAYGRVIHLLRPLQVAAEERIAECRRIAVLATARSALGLLSLGTHAALGGLAALTSRTLG